MSTVCIKYEASETVEFHSFYNNCEVCKVIMYDQTEHGNMIGDLDEESLRKWTFNWSSILLNGTSTIAVYYLQHHNEFWNSLWEQSGEEQKTSSGCDLANFSISNWKMCKMY